MPKRGEVWWTDLDPVVGRELGRKIRPVVIVLDDELNRSGAEKVVVVPSTTQPREVVWPYPGISEHLRGDGVPSSVAKMSDRFLSSVSEAR